MPPTIGRPKVDDPISKNLTIRLDSETLNRLNAYCEKHMITRGQAIRQGIHLLLERDK